MIVNKHNRRLADRLGMTWHVSPLRMKIIRLMRCYPSCHVEVPEDWLIDVAIRRGLKQFVRDAAGDDAPNLPRQNEFSDEELVVALCHKAALDRPQMVRMAGHIISRGNLDLNQLKGLVTMERVEVVIAELARAALRCEPEHPLWLALWDMYKKHAGVRSPVIHWSRLVEPIVDRHHKVKAWKLAS